MDCCSPAEMLSTLFQCNMVAAVQPRHKLLTTLLHWQVGAGNREQLDELLNHFSIEANNPAVCMGQVLAALSYMLAVLHVLQAGHRWHNICTWSSTPRAAIQDVCRQFASETSGRKKYELFLQVCSDKHPRSTACMQLLACFAAAVT
jgi:hypothetical protein